MITTYLIAVLLFLFTCRLLGKKLFSAATLSNQSTLVGNSQDAARVIAGNHPSPAFTNYLTSFQSRSFPNRPLRRAFGIDNAFTSHDEQIVHHFIAEAKRRMNLKPRDWISLSELVSRTIDADLRLRVPTSSPLPDRVPLAGFVQVLCLKVVLNTILHVEIRGINPSHFTVLAEEINRIWMASKVGQGEDSPRYEDEERLHNALRHIFPDLNVMDSSTNPLNFILPSFETLWRIVLRTFIDVVYIAGSRQQVWSDALVGYYNNPTKEVFLKQRSTAAGPVSAKSIVSEGLRLYPPTRRVHRAIRPSPGGDILMYAADIEACQKDISVWGPDATQFVPTRWTTTTTTTKGYEIASFFPFGKKPFVCPAKPVFGPQMVGLLVGALVDSFGQGWALEGSGIREGTYLDRNGFEDIALVRKS